jgi:uncharacterized protein
VTVSQGQNDASDEKRPSEGSRLTLIDTDVHEALRSAQDLVPYLDSHWQRVATEYAWFSASSSFAPHAFPYPFPFRHAYRKEWLDDEGRGGIGAATMAKHLFEDEDVSMAILNGGYRPSSMEGGYEFAAALAAAYNDFQIENWLEKDRRFFGSVHIAPHPPDIAAREIDRVAEHPQIAQVFLPLSSNHQFGDPYYRPIFEAANRNDLAIGMHHGLETKLAVGYPRYWAEWHMLAPPHAAQLQLTSLIFNGVFDEFPDLHVSIMESGVAWVPWFSWRMDENYRMARAEVPWVKRLPSEYLSANVRVGTQPMGDINARQFVQVIEMADLEDVFVFATDYPHYDADSAHKVLPNAMSRDLRAKIGFKNALSAFPRLRAIVP